MYYKTIHLMNSITVWTFFIYLSIYLPIQQWHINRKKIQEGTYKKNIEKNKRSRQISVNTFPQGTDTRIQPTTIYNLCSDVHIGTCPTGSHADYTGHNISVLSVCYSIFGGLTIYFVPKHGISGIGLLEFLFFRVFSRFIARSRIDILQWVV